MNFMFSWQEQYPTRSQRLLVRYCSGHSNIYFISSCHRVISSMSVAANVMSKVLIGGISHGVDVKLRKDQAGFRQGRS